MQDQHDRGEAIAGAAPNASIQAGLRFVSIEHGRRIERLAAALRGELTLKRLFLTAVSIASLAGAIPAAALAQDEAPAYHDAGPNAGPGQEWPLERRIDWLARRIDRAADSGFLSGNEIGRGRSELAALQQEEARLRARDGGQLSPEDRTYLMQRVDELNRTLRWSGNNPPPPWVTG